MPNRFLPRCAPIWGFPAHMTIADLSPSYQPDKVTLLENAIADVSSEAVDLGARGVELTFAFENKDATCNLSLISVTGTGDVVVKTWTGVRAKNVLFAGNLEMVDLQGLPVKVAVSAISAGWVSVFARVTQ